MKKILRRQRKVFLKKSKSEDNTVDSNMHIFHYCAEITFKHIAIEEKSRNNVTGFIRSNFISAPTVHEFRRLVEEEINKIVKEHYYDSLTKETPEMQSIVFRSVSKLS